MEESILALRLLRLPEVLELTGLKKSSIYARSKEGSFPKPVKVGARAVAWYAHEVEEWIKDLPRV